MINELTFNDDKPEWVSGLPVDFNGPILQGAVGFSAKTNIAQLVIQELAGELYSIRFSIIKFLKRVNASGQINKAGLHSCFMLKNSMRKEITSIGKIHLRQDQYSCVYTEPAICKARFEKDIEYRAIDLFYSPQLLQEFLPFFPGLKTVLASPASLLPDKPCWTLPVMKEITNQLLHCSYDAATRRFYFDLKVRELLYELLENAYNRNGREYNFSTWEIGKIHEARNILESYISKKPPSVRSLAKQVALNEFKLKTGFKKYFNSGLFEWLIEKKMQFAKNLILTSDLPIKAICTMIGYPRTTNFITAFRRRFGMTPGSLRRH